ncbi:signal peptidase II [Streptomyces paromomycinus]|uniref:Lipoprotein signal peptidase n=1 Tax=Streptomyces paromomycinus TaxID=92743 RepID=A0A401VW88_STREY|nr:signal peptidase II [Streptomyces paromomycinus]GCD41318.1 lipoprotein signal peptidase [Streptomyces paromomycinus]
MTTPGRATGESGADRTERAGGRRRVPLLLAVAGAAYLLDLGSKVAVVAELEHRAPVKVFGDWLELRVLRNSGAAFGIGEATTILFTLIAVAVTLVIVRLARKLYSAPWAVALGLLLGGGLGNLTDRLFRTPGDLQGAVVDFLHIRGFSVMNFADCAIVCGGVLIVLFSFLGWELDHKDKPAEKADETAVAAPPGATP